jgi:hypothetical protein
MRRPEPTEQELRLAWRHCWRNTWPASFEEAMADALLSRMVRITALHPPCPRRPAAVPRSTPIRRPAVFDRKRAAAGDRDDD